MDNDLELYIDVSNEFSKALRLTKYFLLKKYTNKQEAMNFYYKAKRELTKLLKRLRKRLNIKGIDIWLKK